MRKLFINSFILPHSAEFIFVTHDSECVCHYASTL